MGDVARFVASPIPTNLKIDAKGRVIRMPLDTRRQCPNLKCLTPTILRSSKTVVRTIVPGMRLG